ncbi:MAG: hypothetical protein K2M88_02045 [Muribaculaceae bacterium]|nr:hypothetical protein [Muribaculaceae bacterium]
MDYSAFLNQYKDKDPNQLRLKLIKPDMPIDERERIEHFIVGLECRRKFRGKFRNLLKAFENFEFPSLLAGEQASHEAVSAYHAEIVKSLPEFPFRRFIDMTSGLGMDFIAIAGICGGREKICRCVALDIDVDKSRILGRNLKLIGKGTDEGIAMAEAIAGDSIEYIRELRKDLRKKINREPFEDRESIENIKENSIEGKILIFVDPARRDSGNGRLYDPKDCMPDIPGNLEMIMEVADVLLIKNSPMLEPTEILKHFPRVRRIHIVSYKNECKEVLLEIAKNFEGFEGTRIVNIKDSSDSGGYINEVFDIPSEDSGLTLPSHINHSELEETLKSDLPVYLYEPNAGVMKTGAWGYLSRCFPDLKKASANTHIFLSRRLYKDFPGRVAVIEELIDKATKKRLKGEKINVVSRNHPLTPEKIISDMKLKSSPKADRFLYAITLDDSSKGLPVMLLTHIVK